MKRNYYYKRGRIKWIITSVVFVLVFTFLAGLSMQLLAKQDKFKPLTWFSKVCVKHEYGEDNKCTKCGKDKPVEELYTFLSLNADIYSTTDLTGITPINWDEEGLVKLYNVQGKNTWSYDGSSVASGEVKNSTGIVVVTTKGKIKSNSASPYIVIDLTNYVGKAKITLSFAATSEKSRKITFAENVSEATAIYEETISDVTERFVTLDINGGKDYKISFTDNGFAFYGIIIEHEGEFGLKSSSAQ